jgi:hypothetical protein
MMTKKRNLPWLAAALLLGSVRAQECSVTNDCRTCLENSNCVFAVGTCFSECMEPENGATCYSSMNVAFADSGASAADLCILYNSDNARCTSQKSCRDCTQTLKSDGNSCQWYPDAGENGACFGGGTGPFGPGDLSCPEDETIPPEEPVETDAPTTPAPTTPVPTDPPTDAVVEDPEIVCQAAASDCASCLQAGCAWFPMGACAPSCAELPQDTDCYSLDLFPEFDVPGICETANTNTADREMCFALIDCATCTSTTKSDGTTCQWYIDETTGVDWCQVGGCDQNGICGKETCPTNVDTPPPFEATEPPMDTTPPVDTNVNTTEVDMPDMMNATDTTDWECDDYDAFGSDGCEPCLSSPKNCAWVLNSCVSSCDVIADAPCIDASTFRDTAISEVCAATGVRQEDVALCGSKNYCFTCTSTTKSDGTACSWYTSPDREWCGAGGCGVDGICGSSDESVCQQPEAEETIEEKPEVEATDPPTDVASGGATQRNTLVLVWVLASITWL